MKNVKPFATLTMTSLALLTSAACETSHKTIRTTDLSCETLEPIRYAWHDQTCASDEANVCDSEETVAQILRYNARLEALCDP